MSCVCVGNVMDIFCLYCEGGAVGARVWGV